MSRGSPCEGSGPALRACRSGDRPLHERQRTIAKALRRLTGGRRCEAHAGVARGAIAAGIGSARGPLARPPPPAGGPVGRGARATGRWRCSLVAALALIVAEFLTLREIKAVTAVPAGGLHHGRRAPRLRARDHRRRGRCRWRVGAVLRRLAPGRGGGHRAGAASRWPIVLARRRCPRSTTPGSSGAPTTSRRPVRGRGSGSRRPGRPLLGGGLRVLLRQRLRPARTRRARTRDRGAPATGS